MGKRVCSKIPIRQNTTEKSSKCYPNKSTNANFFYNYATVLNFRYILLLTALKLD